MSFRTSVTIVASPRPRVGKTLLARVLTDFHRHEGRATTAFDLNTGGGLLREFLPKQTQVASIGEIKGQMALFDTLVKPDDTTRVVDLGHDSFESFFALAEHIGFTQEALARGIAPAVLFLLTPDRTAIEAFRAVRRRMPGAALIPAHNEIFGPTQHGDRYGLGAGERIVRLPALAPGLRRFVDVPPFSFADVARAKGMPPEALDELERWLRKTYREFRELDLRLLLADLRSSITLGA
jgi:hypothetical protein